MHGSSSYFAKKKKKKKKERRKTPKAKSDRINNFKKDNPIA